MHHKHKIRLHFFIFWLALGGGLSGGALAAPYDDAMAALEAGDHRKAYRGLKRLALKDHPRAQYELGMLYLSGKGVEKDVAQGIEWLKHAAGNGSYLAANELGQIYLAGRGVPMNEQEAIKWVELATQLAEEHPEEADVECE